MLEGLNPILIYTLIFIARLIEVSVTTVRVVLMTRGNRLAASVLSAFEITVWLIVTSTVLLGIREDPLLGVAFGLAFVIGIYIGIFIEDKLALGLSQIEVIAEFEQAKEIAVKFRERGYGVTTFDCQGLDGTKLALNLKIHRKDIPVTMELLNDYPHLFVTITDIRKMPIGIIKRKLVK